MLPKSAEDGTGLDGGVTDRRSHAACGPNPRPEVDRLGFTYRVLGNEKRLLERLPARGEVSAERGRVTDAVSDWARARVEGGGFGGVEARGE